MTQDYSKQFVRYREGRLPNFGTHVLFSKPQLILSQKGMTFTLFPCTRSKIKVPSLTSLFPRMLKINLRKCPLQLTMLCGTQKSKV